MSGRKDVTSDQVNFTLDNRQNFFSKKSGYQEFVRLLKHFVAILP